MASQSRIIETLNKYVRKMDQFIGKNLDAKISNFITQKPTPKPANTPPISTTELSHKDEFTDTPPPPSVTHIVATSFNELFYTLLYFMTFQYITYYVQFTNAHAILQIPVYLFTAVTVVFTPFVIALILFLDYLSLLPMAVAKTLKPTVSTPTLQDSVVYSTYTSVLQPATATLFPAIEFNTYGKTMETIFSTPKFKYLAIRLILLVTLFEAIVFATAPAKKEPNDTTK